MYGHVRTDVFVRLPKHPILAIGHIFDTTIDDPSRRQPVDSDMILTYVGLSLGFSPVFYYPHESSRTGVGCPFYGNMTSLCCRLFPISVDLLTPFGTLYPKEPVRNNVDKTMDWETLDVSDLRKETVVRFVKRDGRVYR